MTGRPAPTRRDARAASLLSARVAPVRHARARRAARIGLVFGVGIAAALIVGSTVAVSAAITGPAIAHDRPLDTGAVEPMPEQADVIPAPTDAAVPVSTEPCTLAAVSAALDAGDGEAAIVAAGGGEAMRAAVERGDAPCFALDDPQWEWVVINKTRPFDPVDFAPAQLSESPGVRSLEGGSLRSDAAAALSEMVAAAADAGVGEIAMESGYRSYSTQQATYGRHVAERGVEGADLVSARPGYSEHQTGLAADVVACGGGCGTLDDLAATAQGEWVAANSWRHGWIVRYEADETSVTGYLPEPWHLRFVGEELAKAYHAGEYHTLEDFFGLEAAPEYAD